MPLLVPQSIRHESTLFERRLPLKVSADTFSKLLTQGFIVDARSGGLVIGRSHEEGNIYVIQAHEDGFLIEGCLEGGEYVVSKDAYAKHREEVVKINQYKEGKDSSIASLVITPFLRVFSCRSEPFDRLLWMDKGQFIINRGATKKDLPRLVELDVSSNLRLSFDLSSAVFADGGADE